MIPQALPPPGHGIPVCRDPSANALPPRPRHGPHCIGTSPPTPDPSPVPPDMFKLVQLRPHCTGTLASAFFQFFLPGMFKLIHYEAHTFGKQSVCILPECFLSGEYCRCENPNCHCSNTFARIKIKMWEMKQFIVNIFYGLWFISS